VTQVTSPGDKNVGQRDDKDFVVLAGKSLAIEELLY
jgi:hypothetical protein